MPSPSTDLVVPVHIVGWEIECCAPAPGLGDLVSWTLMAFVPGRDRGFDHAGATTRWWRVEHRDDGVVLLEDGPLVAYWPDHSGPPPSRGVREVTVELVAVFHGPMPDRVPQTTGRVRGIQVTSQVFELASGQRCWVPVAGTMGLREVHRAPDSFEDEVFDSEARPRRETGLQIDLAL